MTEYFTPKVSAKAGSAANDEMNGVAKPLVICRAAPNNIEKMKKMAILFCLKRENACKPRASTKLFFSPLLMAHLG